MIKSKKKRGFTIVELVIVIAVIGILSAVLIPIFSGLVAKANVSSDSVLVDSINKQLKIAEVEDGKNTTMYDALLDAKEAGFLVSNINARSNNELVWDQEIDRFALLDSENKVIAGETKNANNKLALWKIYRKASDIPAREDQTYSIYFAGTDAIASKDIKVGFDVGDNEHVAALNYINLDENSAQTVIIRTNSEATTLTINAPYDTVKHYGKASVVDLSAVSGNSYYEYGSVGQVEITKGRLVLTNAKDAQVGTIYLSATNNNYDGIILATQNGAELPNLISRDKVSLPSGDAGDEKKLVVTIQSNVNEEGKNPSKTEAIYLYPASDVKEVTSGYNVSDLGILVVEAISAEAQEEAAAQISDPEVLESVKELKTTYEVSNEGELDSALAAKAKHISIMESFEVTKVIGISYSLIIEGNNKIIARSNNFAGSSRMLWTDDSNLDITIRNLTFDAKNKLERGIQVSSNDVGCKITLENVKMLNVTHYAVNFCGNTSGTFIANNCEFSGWNALNIWGFGHTITINNSTLRGINDKSESSWNNFATICFEADTTNVSADDYTVGNVVTINNSTIIAEETNSNIQAFVSYNKGIVGALNNTLILNSCEIEVARYGILPGVANGGNKCIVDGEVVWSN